MNQIMSTSQRDIVELERQVRALIALRKVELAAAQVEVLALAKSLELDELLPVEMRRK